jgi:hypothetical protein
MAGIITGLRIRYTIGTDRLSVTPSRIRPCGKYPDACRRLNSDYCLHY